MLRVRVPEQERAINGFSAIARDPFPQNHLLEPKWGCTQSDHLCVLKYTTRVIYLKRIALASWPAFIAAPQQAPLRTPHPPPPPPHFYSPPRSAGEQAPCTKSPAATETPSTLAGRGAAETPAGRAARRSRRREHADRAAASRWR